MEKITLRFNGLAGLLMHSGQLANPLSPATIALKEATSKRKKTDEDHELISHLEWLGSLYIKDGRVVVPIANVEGAMIRGAMKHKLGPVAKSGIFCEKDTPLIYSGPKNVEKLWENPNFKDVRGVVVQRNRIMRTRPYFQEWAIQPEIHFSAELVDRRTVVMIAETAGQMIGLGDYRPRFGRFTVEEVK